MDATHQEGAADEQKMQWGDLLIDIDKRKVQLSDAKVELSPKEFELLVLMASNAGKSYSRAQLLDLVWGYDFKGMSTR